MNIWVNGCFDILHTGHIDLFWFAKQYKTDELSFPDAIEKNILYVGIDTDERVKQLKGDKRPINSQYDRLKMLSNLLMIDSVLMFTSDAELRNLIKTLNIDYIIIGDHYKDKEVIGAENAKHGVIFYPTDERSTTDIIEKIKNL